MKFSDLLGEPEPDETPATPVADRSDERAEPDPISVFAPVPMPDRTPPPASVPPVPPPASVPPLPMPSDLEATIPAVPAVPPPVDPPLDDLSVPPPVPVVAPTPTVPPPSAAPPVAPPAPAAPPAPVAVTPVAPTGRSDLASLNVHQPAPEPEAPRSSVLDQLAGLDEVVDDLLPSRRNRR